MNYCLLLSPWPIKKYQITPSNQSWLGYTIGALADHPIKPELAGVYKKNPNLPLQWAWFLIYLFCIMTQVDWTNCMAKNSLKKQIEKKTPKKSKFQKSHCIFCSFSHVLSFLFHAKLIRQVRWPRPPSPPSQKKKIEQIWKKYLKSKGVVTC